MASFATYVGALIEDLADFRVETLILETTPQGMPPADPRALMSEAESLAKAAVDAASPSRTDITSTARVSKTDDLRTYLERANELVGQSTREVRTTSGPTSTRFDPQAMERTRDALKLLDRARNEKTPRLAKLNGSSGTHSDTRAVDHRLLRELSRYRETSHTVWCRTTMRFDGDATTHLRFNNEEAAPVNAAHRAITLSAIDQWQLLIVTFTALVAALTNLRPTLISRKRLTRHSLLESLTPPPGVTFLGPWQVLGRVMQLYSVGRVVFESPAPGAGAVVRTMVLASGDVETSIDREVHPAVVLAHTDLVTRWLMELHDGVLWWSKMFRPLAQSAALLLLLLTITAGAFGEWLSCQTLVPFALAVITQLLIVGGRYLLLWKLKTVAGHLRGRIRVLHTPPT